jgi:hypothetical protein
MRAKDKIENLAPEQTARLAEWRDKWTAIGLSTEPANRADAERAIVLAYAAVKLPAPRIVWCGSPLSQGLTRAIIQKIAADKASVRDSVGASVRDSVWDSVGDSVGDSVRDSVWASGYGQHDASWLGFYDYFRQVCGLHDETRLLEGLTLLAQNAGWFLPHEKICWVSERHSFLHRDEQGRLHCETGPALGYPDKFAIWSWHGTRVPQHVIEAPETITINEIRKQDNAEVRRVMIERMGWEKFCSEAKLKVIHTDTLTAHFPALPVSETVHADMRLVTRYRKGSEVAELLQSDEFCDFGNRPLKFVRVTDPSTGEKYTLRVWPENKRAYEAIGQTFGLTEEEYKAFVYSHS